ncbi:hypothetical protein BH24CHL4_BH24CHL4_11340 [soil metagenome]
MVDPAASAVLKGPTPNYCPVPSAQCLLPIACFAQIDITL